jgi:uncharacterized protein YndB with AHSA1/START domain
MPDVEVEQKVAAAPERVYELISDVTRMGEWSPEATGARYLGGATEPKLGVRFRGRNKRGIRRWSTTCTITRADPARCFEFQSAAGPLRIATWRYEIEPDADGAGCTVTESWTDDRGQTIRTLGAIVSGVSNREDHNRDGMAETLRRLAASAEAS